MSEFYIPITGTGMRWNGPVVVNEWPEVGDITVADRDQAWPLLDLTSGSL